MTRGVFVLLPKLFSVSRMPCRSDGCDADLAIGGRVAEAEAHGMRFDFRWCFFFVCHVCVSSRRFEFFARFMPKMPGFSGTRKHRKQSDNNALAYALRR